MISKQILQSEFVAKLTILSEKQFVPQAQAFVVFYARYFQFPEEELQSLELITEEALVNTIENTFGEDEFGKIDVVIRYLPGKFIISIEDRGIPIDIAMLEKSEHSALGILLMKNLADEFRFLNLGRGGKKLELVKNLPEENLPDMSGEQAPEPAAAQVEQATDSPTIRLITRDDASMLARLAYRVYGYSYMSFFYQPEKIRELIDGRLLVSAVAVNSKDEIVGNLCLFFEKAGHKTADSGAAMVDPRYRGHNLFKTMKSFLKNWASENGMYGLYSEAVTIHPYSQQGNITLGAKETGIMLAYVKENWTFKKISNVPGQRQATVLYYLKTGQEPFRTVYICEKYHPVIKKIYDNLAMQRAVVCTAPSVQLPPLEIDTLISSVFKPDLNVAVISITTIGADAFELVRSQLKEFCLNKVETIYLEMPVDTAASAVLAEQCTTLGFILSGIVPEYRDGDYLKLQYLNNVRVDPSKIIIAADLAKELLADIVKDLK